MLDRKRVAFATTAFLAEMRRQAVVAGSEVAIKGLEDYPPEQRSALISGVEKALTAASPAADNAFLQWKIKTENKDPT